MKPLNHHYKEKEYTCGPAALRIAIESLTNQDPGEELLTRLLGTNDEIGTPLSHFEDQLSDVLSHVVTNLNLSNKFEYTIKQNGSIDELKMLIKSHAILMNYTKPDGQSHWSVLIEITGELLTFSDPDFGPAHKIHINEFNWSGGSKTNPTTKTYIAIG